MKKVPWKLALVVAAVIVAFVALGFVYATGNKAQAEKKATVTSETHGHQEGSAECIEAHKSGRCTGHEPGNGDHEKMQKENPGNGNGNGGNGISPGNGHDKSSPECVDDHTTGKCTCGKHGEKKL